MSSHKSRRNIADNPWMLPIGFGASAMMMVALIAFLALSVHTVATEQHHIMSRFQTRGASALGSNKPQLSRWVSGSRALKQVDEVESRIDTSGIIGDLHELPRPYYDLEEGRFYRSGAPNKIPLDSENPNDFIYYAMGLFLTALMGIILSLFTALTGCIFFTCRCCCGCCGGRSPAKGGYSASSRYFMRIFMYVFGFLVFVTCMVGIGGNVGVKNGLSGLFDVPISVVHRFGNITLEFDEIIENLDDAVFGTATGGAINNTALPTDQLLEQSELARFFLGTVEGGLNYGKGLVLDGDEYRSIVIQGSYIFTLMCAALGVLAALTNTSIPAVLMALFAWAGVPLLWLSFSIHYPVAVFGADTCVTLDAFLNGGEVEGLIGGLCAATDGILDPILDVINQTNAVVQDTVAIAQSLADNQWTQLACNSNGGFANATCAAINQTLQDSIEAVTGVNDAILDAAAAIRRIFDCDYVLSLIDEIQDALCDEFIGSLGVIFVTQAIGASLLMIGSIVGIKAAKRFPTENQASAVDDAVEATQARKDAAFQAAAGDVVGAAPPGAPPAGFQESGGVDYYGQKTY